MEKMNSAEIARLAGVSRSTVSRVVNGYRNVPSHTKEKVMRVINDNGYYPLLSGQLLAGKRTGTLGFFWVSNTAIANDMLGSEYFARVTESAAELGYLVLTCIVKNLTEKENVEWIKRVFMQGRVDAGIFIGTKNNDPLIEELLSKGNIIGIFDHFHPDKNEPNRISVNYEIDTGVKIIDYLYNLGHRKIGIIDGDMSRYCMLKRHEGFLTGMQQHDIEMRGEWMYYADIFNDQDAGYSATKRLLRSSELPTAICAGNDTIAFGVYRALDEQGISIPEQISVIGIDGHGRGELTSPPLTTYGYDYKKMFFSLVKRTIAAATQKSDYQTTEFISGNLVERGSCKSV